LVDSQLWLFVGCHSDACDVVDLFVGVVYQPGLRVGANEILPLACGVVDDSGCAFTSGNVCPVEDEVIVVGELEVEVGEFAGCVSEGSL